MLVTPTLGGKTVALPPKFRGDLDNTQGRFGWTAGDRAKRRPTALIEEVFGLLFAACDINLLTEEELQTYTRDVMTTEIDRQNIIYTARMDGKEEGLAEGLEKGRAEGREEGNKDAARNLKKLGVDIETIMKATGLSEEAVQAL